MQIKLFNDKYFLEGMKQEYEKISSKNTFKNMLKAMANNITYVNNELLETCTELEMDLNTEFVEQKILNSVMDELNKEIEKVFFPNIMNRFINRGLWFNTPQYINTFSIFIDKFSYDYPLILNITTIDINGKKDFFKIVPYNYKKQFYEEIDLSKNSKSSFKVNPVDNIIIKNIDNQPTDIEYTIEDGNIKLITERTDKILLEYDPINGFEIDISNNILAISFDPYPQNNISYKAYLSYK